MLDTLALEKYAPPAALEPSSLLSSCLADPTAQWSVGTFGAIAEFLRDPTEPADVTSSSVVTRRGALCLTPRDDLELIAFETTTRDSWSQRVALCLPSAAARMSMRTVLTEIGPDRAAPREKDRAAVLFDVGIGAQQLDLCIRVSDAELVRQLRAECGKPTFSHESRAGGLILAHSPHRVFMTPLARAEVYQGIPPAPWQEPGRPTYARAVRSSPTQADACGDRADPARHSALRPPLSRAPREGRARLSASLLPRSQGCVRSHPHALRGRADDALQAGSPDGDRDGARAVCGAHPWPVRQHHSARGAAPVAGSRCGRGPPRGMAGRVRAAPARGA